MWGAHWFCNDTTTRVVEENININLTAASTDALQFYWVFRSEWLVVSKNVWGVPAPAETAANRLFVQSSAEVT